MSYFPTGDTIPPAERSNNSADGPVSSGYNNSNGTQQISVYDMTINQSSLEESAQSNSSMTIEAKSNKASKDSFIPINEMYNKEGRVLKEEKLKRIKGSDVVKPVH